MNQGVRNSLRIYALVLALISILGLSASVAFGQAIDGNVVGTVIDSQGAAVVGAEVTATNIATDIVASAKTGATGEYRFDHLLVGTYRITAKAPGFKTINEQVDVEVSKTSTRNLNLTPGATTETVEVSGVPPTLDTTTAQIQSNYETRQTQDLPTASVGLGVLNLSLLQAGVGSSGGLGAGTGPSIGGQRPRDNNFEIEGTDNNDKGRHRSAHLRSQRRRPEFFRSPEPVQPRVWTLQRRSVQHDRDQRNQRLFTAACTNTFRIAI